MAIADFIFTALKNRFPDLDWKVGSTLRELIAAPLVTAAERASISLDSQLNLTNINDFSELTDDQVKVIDDLFYRLDLQNTPTVLSKGTATVLTKSTNAPTILAGTMFTYNDLTISVAETVEPSISPTDSNSYVPLRQIGYESYAFEVPITCVTINTTLTQGTPLSWAEAPESVYGIIITNPLSGGKSGLTSENKLSMIKDYLAPNILSLDEGLAKLLRDKLNSVVSDCKYARDINDPSKTYVYLKTFKAPGNFYVQAEAVKSDNLYIINKEIPGVVDVLAVYVDGKKENALNKTVENNKVYCELAVDKETNVISVELEVYGLSDAHKVQEFIDGYTLGTPYKWSVIAPSLFEISLEFKYKGSNLYTSQLQEICERFQAMSLNARLSDSYLSQILAEYGATLVGACTYTITDIKGNCYKQITAPVIRNTKHEAYALYIGVNNIKAIYV